MNQMLDTRMEDLKENLNYFILSNYGTRLTIGNIKEEGINKFSVFFNYNKIFNIRDELNKKIYIRNIYFKDIFSTQLKLGKNLKIPVHDINRAIDSEFVGLRDSLFKSVISNKNIILKILKKVHTTSAFLNKFYTILNDLVYSDVLPKSRLAYYLDEAPKFKKYIELIINSGLASYTEKGELKQTNLFKTIQEKNNKNLSTSVEEGMYLVLSKNYEYIIYEMSIVHIKAYVDIISCLFYLYKNLKLERVAIKLEDLYTVYRSLFGKRIRFGKFMERVNSLVISDVLVRTNNSVSLATL